MLDVIRPLSTLTVRGNHDRACSGISSTVQFNPVARTAANWTFVGTTFWASSLGFMIWVLVTTTYLARK